MPTNLQKNSKITPEHWVQITEVLGQYSERLLPFTRFIQVSAGTDLLQEGVYHDNLYLVIGGQLEASRQVAGSVISLGTIHPGQWLGDVCVIDQGTATATITAQRVSTLLVLSHGQLVALQNQAPDIAGAVLMHVTRELAARLRQSTAVIFQAVNNDNASEPVAQNTAWVNRAMGWLLCSEAQL